MKETIWTKIKRKKYEAKQWIRKKAMKAKAWIQVKVSMKKRAVKRAVKEWTGKTFHRKRNRIRELEAELISKNNEIEELKKRFRRLGTQIDTMEVAGRIRTIKTEIKIRPIPFGTYISMDNRTMEDWNDENIERVKSALAEQLAEALIEQNMVQFIVNNQCQFDPLNQFTTVGAKLSVVPWEEMAERVIKILRSHL